ncbi:hypothetical protein PVAP13_9NG430914 [Panicum virgatum]|uniref:Uncharacterized protein n=1 Tax=Panicum virgatum TaxID=38727 RepID=A0A8T0MP92_PANVG|nr:hypothetical protein PVAP13_9NG430914 [Panicum virgatum]
MPYSSSHGTNLLWRPCHPLNRHHQPSGDAVLEGAGVARTSIPGGGEALQGTGGTGWSSRKRRPKAWEGATPRCHGRQVRAAGTSVVRKGRWRKISSRRSSPRERSGVPGARCVGSMFCGVRGADLKFVEQSSTRHAQSWNIFG